VKRRAATLLLLLALCAAAFSTSHIARLYADAILGVGKTASREIAELQLERTIPLGSVTGRIDHLAADVARKRLFIAELGNGSVGVVDLDASRVIKRLTGLQEPQGIAYAPAQERLFVANGGDGRVRVYRGDDLAQVGEIALGDDADNVRIDSGGRVLVGYGSGAIAVLNPSSLRKIGDLPLAAHPESFQPDPDGKRVFVNEPRALRIGVIDRDTGKEIAKWGVPAARENFPMALDPINRRLFVAYRMPALVAAFDTRNGDLAAYAETCHDADDVFVDARRRRLYVTCGEGVIDVIDEANLAGLGRLKTRSGARTSLFIEELDRLLVAIPASHGAPAEIRVYKPR